MKIEDKLSLPAIMEIINKFFDPKLSTVSSNGLTIPVDNFIQALDYAYELGRKDRRG